MVSEVTLRMAALSAVLAEIEDQNSSDPALIGRNIGVPWSQDHRRMMTGLSSFIHRRDSRAPWR